MAVEAKSVEGYPYLFFAIGELIETIPRSLQRSSVTVRIDTDSVPQASSCPAVRKNSTQDSSNICMDVHALVVDFEGLGPPTSVKGILTTPPREVSSYAPGSDKPVSSRLVDVLKHIGTDVIILARSAEHGSSAALVSQAFTRTYGGLLNLVPIVQVLPPSGTPPINGPPHVELLSLDGAGGISHPPGCWREFLGRFGPYGSWAGLVTAVEKMPPGALRIVFYSLTAAVPAPIIAAGTQDAHAPELPDPDEPAALLLRAPLAGLLADGADDVLLCEATQLVPRTRGCSPKRCDAAT